MVLVLIVTIHCSGHGTYLDTDNNAVLAGVAGRVERVNKLVSVRALRGRYKPEVGDLVVGRVVEVMSTTFHFTEEVY